MTQFSPTLLAVLVYAALFVCAIGVTILLVLLWRDLRKKELW